jgi:hypothetical protein
MCVWNNTLCKQDREQYSSIHILEPQRFIQMYQYLCDGDTIKLQTQI